jgi:alkylation response protein AidB-like acyl-CoA dehydrogenase
MEGTLTLLIRQIAFLKMAATQAAQETARDAVQLFGGRGITKTGMGRFIEHVSVFVDPKIRDNLPFTCQYHRTITFDSLLGGGKSAISGFRPPSN